MKEDRLNTLRQQDAALRDAIRMEEQELPQMPADLNARVMKKTHPQPLPVREGSGHPVVRRLWPWMAAAASLLILIGVGLTMMPEKQMPQSSPVVAEKVEKKPQQVNHGDSPHDASEAMNQRDCPHDSQPRQIPAQPQKLKLKPVVAEQLLAQESAPAEEVAAENPAETANDVAMTTQTKPKTLTDSDIPITRPENYHYTPEEIALMKRQANEAYLKWVELELEIAKYNQEQTAQK